MLTPFDPFLGHVGTDAYLSYFIHIFSVLSHLKVIIFAIYYKNDLLNAYYYIFENLGVILWRHHPLLTLNMINIHIFSATEQYTLFKLQINLI